MTQDIYDFPRERLEKEEERGGDYIYDMPPQVGGAGPGSTASEEELLKR